MATIDLTLNGIKIPALDGYTPPFGTKKVSGGLTTQEVNDNVIAPFVKERPIEITEDSSTGNIEYNASLVINSADAVLTLGSGTYWKSISCPVEIGDVYTQLPDVAEPAAIYGGQWEEHDYGGMFFRSAGGNAKAFTAPIAGSFTSGTVFAASAALPAGVAAGDLVIAGSEYRTISSISGQNITIDSAFTNYSNITNLLIGSPETLPNITGFIQIVNYDNNNLVAGGAFYRDTEITQTTEYAGVTSAHKVRATARFSANISNKTYQTNAHVQPNNISCRSWLRVS